jgi:tetratricopeptide (TPR) repeat protein
VALTLASVAGQTRDRAAAESLYRAARDIQRAVLGPDDLAVATTDIQLAVLRERQGAYDDAEALFRESLGIRERQLGPDHGGAALSMIFLAGLLREHLNRPVEAESLYNRALGILRQQPPQWLPQLVGALAGLAAISAERGDYVRAEAFAREILDAQRRTWGAEHPMITEGMALVARQLAAQRRYAEAEAMLRESIALLERGLSPDHFRVGAELISLGRVHSAAGRRDEAEADLRRALAIMERSEGPRTRLVGMVSALRAELLAQKGEKAESDGLFDRSASILRPLPPQTDPDMRAAYAALAEHYRATKQPTEEAYFRRLAERR